jgi:hypothetical protein
MPKNKRVPFYVDEEWLKGLSALAGTFGVSAEAVIRLSLPDAAVIDLFFQCKDYLPELQWDKVADVGRTALREHLRATYMRGLEEHLARLGLNLYKCSSPDAEAAKKRALDELQADTAHPLAPQIQKAQDDSVYLGRLYDAWKRARAGEPGYTIAEADMAQDAGPKTKFWAVLKDNSIV